MDTNDALNSRENSSEDETGSDEDKDDIVSYIWCISIKMSPLLTDHINNKCVKSRKTHEFNRTMFLS